MLEFPSTYVLEKRISSTFCARYFPRRDYLLYLSHLLAFEYGGL